MGKKAYLFYMSSQNYFIKSNSLKLTCKMKIVPQFGHREAF